MNISFSYRSANGAPLILSCDVDASRPFNRIIEDAHAKAAQFGGPVSFVTASLPHHNRPAAMVVDGVEQR